MVIVIPAYNSAHTLVRTFTSIPAGSYDEIVIVDDGSSDDTSDVARHLNATVVAHAMNRGYGAAQKTGYREALKRNADIVVLLHGDNQYDPSYVPAFVKKIAGEGFDLVTGTRMILGDVLKEGMPVWKFIPNRFLTGLENLVFGSHITDYHNGFRAYSAKFLRQVPLGLLSDKFDFDTDIIIQGIIRKYRIGEVAHPTRYSPENSQMSFSKGINYGLSVLRTVYLYLLHETGIKKQAIFSINEETHQ